MIPLLALRSLLAHPIRTAVLGCGFGLGVAVMATLLGVGQVVLDQARAPALAGGGDLLITGAAGRVTAARFVLAHVLKSRPLVGRAAAASPTSRASLFLVRNSRVVPIRARGGIPSLERALGDPESASIASWTDEAGDTAWQSPNPADVLRAMDRFHPIPNVPARADGWLEWLYFNGRATDARFYLTFLVGPRRPVGKRLAGVRLQLDRGGRLESYSDSAEIDEAQLLAEAPDLMIGSSRVRLEGLRYQVALDVPAERPSRGVGSRVTGALFLDAIPGRALPPLMIRGAAGWLSGYVVPVMSGTLGGSLTVDGRRVRLDGGVGYHDHNWGFWQGVSWRWGQVQHGDLSFVYGRVFPPADAADRDRVPGFLAALGPDGPMGYTTTVSIEETDDVATRRPRRIVVRGRSASLDLTMDLTVDNAIVTRMGGGAFGSGMDFYQFRARYRVVGRVGSQSIDFTAGGSAETFRGQQ